MKILIVSKAEHKKTIDDLNHGLRLLKLLLNQSDIDEVSWLMYFGYGFSGDLQQQYELLANSVVNNKFPKKNILAIKNDQGGLRGTTLIEALVEDLKKSQYDLIILPTYYNENSRYRYDYTFMTRLPQEKQKVKMLFVGEYNLTDEAPDEIPALYTGLSASEDDRKRLGIYTNSPFAPADVLENLVEKNKIALITDGSLIKMEDVNFADLCSEWDDNRYDHFSFIRLCIKIAMRENRKQCTVVLDQPISVLEKHLIEIYKYELIKKDKLFLEFKCDSAISEMKLRLVNPFPLAPETIQYILKESHLVTGATGDSSYVEALSKHKLVLHDYAPFGSGKSAFMKGYYLLLKNYLSPELQKLFDAAGVVTLATVDNPTSELANIVANHKTQLITALQQTFDEIKQHHSLENCLWPAIKSAAELESVVAKPNVPIVAESSNSNMSEDASAKLLSTNGMFAHKPVTDTDDVGHYSKVL
ncbi:MAG: hypothetical protein WC627_07750 [Legionella sp.]|jgi:hypothetical protein